MGMYKRIERDEFQLPEAMIQHIQSFLTGKEAAQTCILSKSWYSAWSTRPNLDFNEHEFGIKFNRENKEFWKFAAKTIQRYEELKIKIESFRLSMLTWQLYNCYLVKEFIVKAIKMGAVDFNFEMSNFNETFTLPREVLESETLINLSVNGCRIDLTADRKVNCLKLKSLILKRMWVKGDIIKDLILICPLIEKLTLGSFIRKYSDAGDSCELGFVVHGYKLHKLKSLFLGGVKVDNLFFSNMSSNFPCLKDLNLDDCSGYNYKGIRLSSRSLECISFNQERLLRANFDVPSIRKFTFSGSNWPSLIFKTVSREWESDICVTCRSRSTMWFLKLNKLLTRLSSSKISLSLSIDSVVEKTVDFQALPKTEVENLTMHAPCSVWSVVLECLFGSCRPKFVTLYYVSEWSVRRRLNNEFLGILRERNVQRVREKFLMINDELEEVINMEVFEESFAERRTLPQKIHLQLRWRVKFLSNRKKLYGTISYI